MTKDELREWLLTSMNEVCDICPVSSECEKSDKQKFNCTKEYYESEKIYDKR